LCKNVLLGLTKVLTFVLLLDVLNLDVSFKCDYSNMVVPPKFFFLIDWFVDNFKERFLFRVLIGSIDKMEVLLSTLELTCMVGYML
jgi:hypothetical protein